MKSVATDHPVAEQGTIRENKLALVERLADDLAHEIKNPLHSMVINLEVLRRRLVRLENDAGDDLLRYAGVLSSELERVNRRVDLLLRMVRPPRESDEASSLAEVLEELRELVELECERHEVRLQMESAQSILPASLPRASTRQMILSLILKTLDSSPAGSSLHVRTDVLPGSMRLHIYALDRAGTPPPSSHPTMLAPTSPLRVSSPNASAARWTCSSPLPTAVHLLTKPVSATCSPCLADILPRLPGGNRSRPGG